MLRTLPGDQILTIGLQGSKGEEIPEITKLRRRRYRDLSTYILEAQ